MALAARNLLDPLGLYEYGSDERKPADGYDDDEDIEPNYEDEFIAYVPQAEEAARRRANERDRALFSPLQEIAPPHVQGAYWNTLRSPNTDTGPLTPQLPRRRPLSLAPSRASPVPSPLHTPLVIRPPDITTSRNPSPGYSLLSFPPSGPSEPSSPQYSSPRSSRNTISSPPTTPLQERPAAVTPSSTPLSSPPKLLRRGVPLPDSAMSSPQSLSPEHPRAVFEGSLSRTEGSTSASSWATYPPSRQQPPPSTRSSPSRARSMLHPPPPVDAGDAGARNRVQRWLTSSHDRSFAYPDRTSATPTSSSRNMAPTEVPALTLYRPRAHRWDAASIATFSTNMTSQSRRPVNEDAFSDFGPNGEEEEEEEEALSLSALPGPTVASTSASSCLGVRRVDLSRESSPASLQHWPPVVMQRARNA
ncbi:hypothetical protein EXIGLDRAFT_762074 [Exidia glandulosa HHB12029]|uniref:Uncharacterized protein n=1 Tax=Exidia glandulosa HHB12029 TaxID=1314781 RepID=A0A165MZ65_EXIGL|nr:hypothetical protein EXIGLDRAFT_762074 [Exidia glandulosa HHB12029]